MQVGIQVNDQRSIPIPTIVHEDSSSVLEILFLGFSIRWYCFLAPSVYHQLVVKPYISAETAQSNQKKGSVPHIISSHIHKLSAAVRRCSSDA